jgi:hypothetical protein
MSFLSDAEIVINALENYYQESISKKKPVINQVPMETLISDLDVRDKLIAQGEFYLSTTAFGGQRYLRMVFNHPHTCLDDIKQLIQKICYWVE